MRCTDFFEVEETVGSITVDCTRSLDLSVLSLVQITSTDGTAVGMYYKITFTASSITSIIL